MKKVEQKIKDTLSILNSGKGFTLLELLVVVLIIGILAAIALPQYKKVVLKSRFAAIKDMTRAIYDAEQRYYLVHSQYTKNWNDLDIDRSGVRCSIDDPNSYIFCTLTNSDGNKLLQYIIMTQTGKLRCDAFPGDPDTLTNKICQEETGRTTPSNTCGTSFCIYYQ